MEELTSYTIIDLEKTPLIEIIKAISQSPTQITLYNSFENLDIDINTMFIIEPEVFNLKYLEQEFPDAQFNLENYNPSNFLGKVIFQILE